MSTPDAPPGLGGDPAGPGAFRARYLWGWVWPSATPDRQDLADFMWTTWLSTIIALPLGVAALTMMMVRDRMPWWLITVAAVAVATLTPACMWAYIALARKDWSRRTGRTP